MSVSQHPIDQLLRELIETKRAATAEEITAVAAHIAAAPFESRVVAVPPKLRDRDVAGRRLGARAPSLDVHFAKRMSERQWTSATSAQDYLDDLRRAVRLTTARFIAYRRRGGYIACVVSATTDVVEASRRGAAALPLLLIVYAIDRGIIISGYQVSSIEQTGIPGEAQWLNARSMES